MENVKPVAEPPGVLLEEKDTSVNSTETSKTIIAFEKDDPENPYNWSRVSQSRLANGHVLTFSRTRSYSFCTPQQ